MPTGAIRFGFRFRPLRKKGRCGYETGAIVAFGTCEQLLPAYRFESVFQPVFIRVFLKRLRQWGLSVNLEKAEGLFRRYSGDITALGKGEILIYDSNE